MDESDIAQDRTCFNNIIHQRYDNTAHVICRKTVEQLAT